MCKKRKRKLLIKNVIELFMISKVNEDEEGELKTMNGTNNT